MKKTIFTNFLFFIILFAASAKSIYVDQASMGLNTGQRWEDAYTDLQDALATVENGDSIWIAEGTYYPTNSTNRRATFKVNKSITLIGGFSKNEARIYNPVLYPTILSADIGEKDNNLDNAHTILELDEAQGKIHIQGFIIEKAKATEEFVIQDNIIRNGGGMYVKVNNTADLQLTILDCVFNDHSGMSRGSAIYLFGNAPINIDFNITNCKFYNNGYNGLNNGTIHISTQNNKRFTFRIHKSKFKNNSGWQGEGVGIYRRMDDADVSLMDIEDCVFEENYGRYGTVYDYISSKSDSMMVKNSIFKDNEIAFEGGAIRHFSLGTNKVIYIKNTNFIANYGHLEIDTDIPASLGGALMIENLDYTPARNAQLIIEDSKFINNASKIGAAIYSQSFNHKISNCLFAGHHAPLEGGVIYIGNNLTSNTFNYYNNTFYNNSADVNGGIFSAYRTFTTFGPNRINFYNSAFINNQSKQGASIGYLESCIVNFYNCMMDNAKNDSIIYYNAWSAFAGVNFENTFFDTDALLAAPEEGDFSLSPCSPAIDKGDNRYIAQNNLLDVIGNPRIINNRVDIGAYENMITQLEVEFDVIGNSCRDINTGYVNFEFKNGCSPYTYTWERNSSKGTGNTDLAIGTYNITITDAVGKQGQVSVIIDTFNLRYASTLILPTCPENKNGAISIRNLSQDSLSYLWANGSANPSISDLGVGQYTVTITNQNGCQATTQFELTISDTIQVSYSIVNASSSDSSDGKISIESISGGQPPYKVSVNTVPIERVSSLSVGNYQLKIEDDKGCIKVIPFKIDVATNTREWQLSSDIEIFPNPANIGKVTIKLPQQLDLKATAIRIVDLHGRVVYQKAPSGQFHEVSISNLASAMYIVQVISKDYFGSTSFLIE